MNCFNHTGVQGIALCKCGGRALCHERAGGRRTCSHNR